MLQLFAAAAAAPHSASSSAGVAAEISTISTRGGEAGTSSPRLSRKGAALFIKTVPSGVPMKMDSTQHHCICCPYNSSWSGVLPFHDRPGLAFTQAVSVSSGTVAKAACVVA